MSIASAFGEPPASGGEQAGVGGARDDEHADQRERDGDRETAAEGVGSGGTHGAARHLSGGGGRHDARRRHVATLRVVARPVVGIPTPVEHAAWARVWEMDAAVLAMSYVEAVQRAGGVAMLLPPDAHLVAHPDEALDHLDALLLAGGADLAPETYGAQPHPHTVSQLGLRDAFELALASGALARDMPVLGVCRGMQVLNVARGGTLHQHVPELIGHEDHRRIPGTFGDHDVRLVPGSLAARAAGGVRHPDEVPSPPGRRPDRRRPAGDGLGDGGRPARGDRAARRALRPRRAVASGGGCLERA